VKKKISTGREDVHPQNRLNELILNWCIGGCWFTPAKLTKEEKQANCALHCTPKEVSKQGAESPFPGQINQRRKTGKLCPTLHTQRGK
jgi:hypothetical protein